MKLSGGLGVYKSEESQEGRRGRRHADERRVVTMLMRNAGNRRSGGMVRGVTRLRATTLFAGSLSLCVHLCLLLVLALIVLERPLASVRLGTGESPLAVLSEADLRDFIYTDLREDTPTETELTDPEIFTDADMSASSLHESLSALDVGDLGALSGSGGDEVGEGVGSAAVGGSAASFFGVEARGTRFAYVVDVSGSMMGERMEMLKGALTVSIQSLSEGARFSIILFSSDAHTLTRGWVEVTPQSVRETLTLIRGIQAGGGTNPLPGFEIAFGMSPKPDAIYFMTDGIFAQPDMVAQAIDRMNSGGGRKAQVHCITFIDRDAEQIMRVIARRSGGTYTHISGSGRP